MTNRDAFRRMLTVDPELEKPTRVYTFKDTRTIAIQLGLPIKKAYSAFYFHVWKRTHYQELMAEMDPDPARRAAAQAELELRKQDKAAAAERARLHEMPKQKPVPPVRPKRASKKINIAQYKF